MGWGLHPPPTMTYPLDPLVNPKGHTCTLASVLLKAFSADYFFQIQNPNPPPHSLSSSPPHPQSVIALILQNPTPITCHALALTQPTYKPHPFTYSIFQHEKGHH